MQKPAISIDKNGEILGYFQFWILAFLYACCMAIVLQKLVLPLLPDLHAGHGLMKNDAITFHKAAIVKSVQILEYGWSRWELFPQGFPANVGLLSILYTFFGPDPVLFVPINAGAHALGATVIYRLGNVILPGRRGQLGGLIAGILYLVFPTALHWYGQNHKDAFACAGLLLLLLSWLELSVRETISKREVFSSLICAFAGTLLLGLVRPHYPYILILALVMATAASAILFWGRDRRLPSLATMKGYAGVLMVLLAVGLFVSQFNTRTNVMSMDLTARLNFHESTKNWEWQSTNGVPSVVDEAFMRISALRSYFVGFGRKAGAQSEIDGDRQPENIFQAIAYGPRAVLVGLLAPFPSFWAEKTTLPRLMAAMETALWYLIAAGVLPLLLRRSTPHLMTGIVFCLILIGLLAYINPNIGTIYRQRYAFWMFILMCGAVGWTDVLSSTVLRFSKLRRVPSQLDSVVGEPIIREQKLEENLQKTNKVAASGAIAVVLTFVCFLGFFVRDLILINRLGISIQLDAFFTGTMVPMFIVTFIAMPMADSLMRPFVGFTYEQSEQRSAFIQHLLVLAVGVLGVIAILSVLLAPWFAQIVLGAGKQTDRVAETVVMLRWYAPIIVLSAWTVIGNAVLNAFHKSKYVASAQLIVPILTIVVIISVPVQYVTKAAVFGMLTGTFCNGLIVCYFAWREGVLVVPRWSSLWQNDLKQVFKHYARLVLAALLTAALIPLNYTFAGMQGEGAVSTWAFASKIVVFFTGLATFGVSAVVLPHFARLVNQGWHVQFRNQIFFMLLLGGWMGAALALVIFLFAEPMVGAVLSNKQFATNEIEHLATLVRIGALQLPFVIPGVLLVKAAAVTGGSLRMMIAAGLGFFSNLVANYLLVPYLGMIGVAVGALSAASLSAFCLLLLTHRRANLNMLEMLTIVVSWVVWCVVCVAIGSGAFTIILFGGAGIALLLWIQLQTWRVVG
ncbi:Peptidoglycan biosynthesis protein MviN/MurJ, putative lipid II flippase [Cohaesibacter gelatinilyticus]|uniref:Peptidoglycan biosynthesis protein MviN/MurJ, putative lipid II flippase n=2 Tax=Cohaesibacter gelatinilyticus TaxID=372072 RepID=A0A285PEL5_9HYPH|nr:Peptidoglycan biosynthesis protein MviN/MurJ, putative lipid II flippase [Cohaesibacter gelatinilyticus]